MANVANFISLPGLVTFQEPSTNPGSQLVYYRKPQLQPFNLSGATAGDRPERGQIQPRGNT